MDSQPLAPAAPPSSATARPPIRGRLLVVVRIAWLALVLFSVGLFVGALPTAYVESIVNMLGPHRVAAQWLGLSVAGIAAYIIVLESLLVLVNTLVALTLFAARSDDWMAVLVSVAFLAFGPTVIGSALTAFAAAHAEWAFAVSLLRVLGGSAILFVFYLFPDGRFAPAWTRVAGVLLLVWLLAYSAFPVVMPNPQTWPAALGAAIQFLFWSATPTALSQIYTTFREFGFSVVLVGWFMTGAYAQLYRYRWVSTPVQRQQTKWIVVGILMALLGAVVWFVPQLLLPYLHTPMLPAEGIPSLLFNLIGLTVLVLCLLCIPLAFALSISHYRLWDVDALISRALVSGAVTVLLGAAYFGLVYLFQWAFLWVTGHHSDVAVVASTLVIAALVRPLGGRIQRLVDRFFYREKVDFRRTFTDFAREIRTMIELPDLLRVLLQRTTQLLHSTRGAVFLRPSTMSEQAADPPETFELAEALGLPPDPKVLVPYDQEAAQQLQAGQPVYRPKDRLFPLVIPLIAPRGTKSQLVGALALGPRLSGQGYTRDDQAVLSSLADQAGVAIYVARLIKEKEAEARRLEEAEERLEAHRQSPLGRAEVAAEKILAEPSTALVQLYELAQIAGHDANAAALLGSLPQVFDNMGHGAFARLAEGFNYIFTSPLMPEVLQVGLRLLATQLEQPSPGGDLEGASDVLAIVRVAQTALEAATIPQITAWAAAQPAELAATSARPALSRIHRAFRELLAGANALRSYERVDTPQDRLAYLAGAVERLGRVERLARNELGSAERPVVQRLAEHWLAVVTGAMSELQTRAQLVCQLLTRHTWEGEVISVALNVRNEGRGAAVNLRLTLAPSAEYTLMDKEAQVARLAPGDEAQVELRVRPRLELGMDRFRARFVILYADPRSAEQVENFADVVHLMAATSEFAFIPNPYVVGTPLQPASPLFFGREDVVAFIQENLAAAHRNNLVLIGQRRTGKSSLLKQLPVRLGEAYVPVYLDGQSLGLDPGLPNFFLALATEIAFALEDRQFTVRVPEASELADSPAATFERRFLRDVRTAIGDRHLLLLLDEFEELEAAVRRGNLDVSVFAFLRHLIQHAENLSVVFCGTHRLEELAADYWSVLFNISLYRHIGFLEQAEAVRLMEVPVAAYGMRYDDLAMDKVWRVTAGHPYFLQLLCHSLVNRHNKTQRSYTTVGDVNAALDEIVASGEAHFVYLWTEANPDEKLVLTVLSRLGAMTGLVTPVEVVDYLAERGMPVERSAMAEALRRLALRDILKSAEGADPASGDAYRWKLGLLGLWVEKYKSLSHVVGEINRA
jgi:hypothetical protein